MPNIATLTVTVQSDPPALLIQNSLQYPLTISADTEAQVIVWNLETPGQTGTFNAISPSDAENSGFSWTYASEEGQINPFSIATRTNDDMSILLVDFHTDTSSQDIFSYKLIATVNGVQYSTNPQSAKGTAGDPYIQNM